jgi:EmrB/QacA subfamily drug resistance transporter
VNGADARRRRDLALLVAGTFFMENLDGTILTTAVPSIGASLEVPAVSVGTAITAYLLTLAVLIPLSGWAVLRFGGRRVFLAAIVVFTAASIGCAAAPTLPVLVAARVLQGAGGAMMVPVGRLVVLRDTAPDEIVRVIALFTWPALAAPVIAPLLGGVLTTTLGWRSIFLVNVPLGLVAFVVAWRLVHAAPAAEVPRLDVGGLVLVCLGIGPVVSLGSLLAERHPSWPAVAVLVVVGGAGLAGAVRHLRRTPHPLVSLDALGIASFRLAHLGGSVFRLATNAAPFVLPLLFQVGFGWSPVESGALLLTLFGGNLLIKPATTPMLARLGFRRVLLIACLGAAVSVALYMLLSPDTPVVLVVAVLLLGGVVRSIGWTGYNTVAFADVPPARLTGANTLASTLQQVSAGLGVTVGAVALGVGSVLSDAVGAPPLTPYRFAFGVIAVLLLPAAAEVLRAPAGLGDRIRPVRRAPRQSRGRPGPA